MNATYLKSISLAEAKKKVELDLASELFHRINRVIPENQKLACVPPTILAGEAIHMMLEKGFSQLPVVQGTRVLGVFSYRSFSKISAQTSLNEMQREGVAPRDLQVDEFLEQWDFVSIMDEWRPVFGRLDAADGLLVGSKDNLIGVLSPMDLLRYLDNIASPYVMISEIEMSLRALIRVAIDEDQLAMIAEQSLAHAYSTQNIPQMLEQMTFEDYRSIISRGDNWRFFGDILGTHRKRISGHLRRVGAIRNDLFHLKRALTIDDHETISNFRNWLLNKTEQI